MSSPATPAPVTASAAPQKKKSRRKLVIVLVVLVLLAAIGATVAVVRRKDLTVEVTTEKAVTKTITQIVSATGKIQPEVEVKIAPEVSGEIIKLPLREGAAVKKGDLLVSIKPDSYQAQVEQQEAGLASAKASAIQAQAQLHKTRGDLQRSEELFSQKLISDADIATARLALDVAQANLDSAEAQIRRTEGSLNQARDQLTKTTIYAPIDGTVSSLTNEVGERVAGTGSYGGAEVMRVADLSNMEVRVNINENDIINVKVGDKAKVAIDAFPNRKFEAVVKEIGSAAKVSGQNTQDEVTNFLVKIRLLDKDVHLRPGMSANAEVETETVQNVVAVPIQSVTVRARETNKTMEQVAADRDKQEAAAQGEAARAAVNVRQQEQADKNDRSNLQRVVFVLQGDTVKMVKVETGLQDTTHIEIKSGLQAGADVVSGSFGVITRTLKDGMAVRLEKPKTPGAK